MTFDEGDKVVLLDPHSEHEGDVGEITQVMETMFGDSTYTVSFDDGQETGIPADLLELASDEDDEDLEEE